jgi:GntR family transcriptional regulator, transcriptional repressor for pyruvate dehydrogenase complex
MPLSGARPKVSKSEFVASSIRDYITEEGLKPGDRLPTEADFADRFGVSRVAVREATKVLAFLGVIDAAPRRGLTVGDFSMEKLSGYLGFHFNICDYPVEELLDTRIILEVGGLPHVARRMQQDPSIYERWNDLNARMRETTELADWVALDMQFHCELVASTNLRGLATLNELVQIFFRRFREDFPRKEWSKGVESHQVIMDALRTGDSEAAAAELTRHINSHRGRMRDQATHDQASSQSPIS